MPNVGQIVYINGRKLTALQQMTRRLVVAEICALRGKGCFFAFSGQSTPLVVRSRAFALEAIKLSLNRGSEFG